MPYFDQALVLAEELGLAGVFDKAREYQTRAAYLDETLKTLRASEERNRDAVVREVAAGKTSPEDIPARLPGAWIFDSPASKTLIAACAAAANLAEHAAATAGPELFEALREMCAEVVSESARLAATLPPGVRDRERAYDAGVFGEWQQLDRLALRWQQIQDLVDGMRRAGWVESFEAAGGGSVTPDRHLDRRVLYLQFLIPSRIPPLAPLPRPLRLAACVRAQSGPGVFHARDAVARWRQATKQEKPRSNSLIQTFSLADNRLIGQSS
jgi:hypothetical protein